ACVFQGRGRGLHGAQVDLVLHDLQAGADVAVDARGEQGEDRLVIAQLRDLPQDHLIDIPGYRGGPAAYRRRDAGYQLGDCGAIDVHLRILTHSGEHAEPWTCSPLGQGAGDLDRSAASSAVTGSWTMWVTSSGTRISRRSRTGRLTISPLAAARSRPRRSGAGCWGGSAIVTRAETTEPSPEVSTWP